MPTFGCLFASFCLVCLRFSDCHCSAEYSNASAALKLADSSFLPHIAKKKIQEKSNMDALAESWFRSGKKPDDLYKGGVMEIIKELKVWLIAREDRNHANFDLLWDFFDNNATILDLANQYATINDMSIVPFKAKHVKNVERVKVRRYMHI